VMAQPKLILSDMETPTRLGRYQLGRELGRGFSSIVYEATDTLRGNRAAVKVLTFLQNLTPARRYEMTERFEREARAISALSHPAIVAIYEVGQVGEGQQFIAMEYLEGETLRARIERQGPMLRSEAVPLMVQIADALQYAHGRGVIHRDVKPDNIFLCADGSARLMDFGIAHVFADDGLTQTGMLIGSPAYMSPEQINGDTLDGRTDVFSLAATLAEALTGSKPFDAPNIPAVMNRILNQPPQLTGIGDAGLRRTLERALDKAPSARTASAGAFAEALRKAVPFPGAWETTTGTQVMAKPVFLPKKRPVRNPLAQAWAWGAAGLCLLLLASLPFLPRHTPPAPVKTRIIIPAPSPALESPWTETSAQDAPRPRPAHFTHSAAVRILRPAERITSTRDQVPLAVERPAAFQAAPDTPPEPVVTGQPVVPVSEAPEPLVTITPVRRFFPAAPVHRTTMPRLRRSASFQDTSVQDAPAVETPAPMPAPISAPMNNPSPVTASPAPAALGIDTPARLVLRTGDVVPPGLLSQSGSVSLLVSVNQVGNVSDARVTQSSGNMALDSAAIATVMRWEFEPAFHNGHAVPSEIGETVSFP
jgi:TonB family protein